MKKCKVLFSIMSSITLLLALFSGCGGSGGQASPQQSAAPSAANSAASTASSAPAESSAETIVIKLGHVQAETHPYHLALLELQKILDEKRPGAVRLDLFPNSTMGGERDMLEGMQMGTIDASLPSTASLGGFTNEFNVFDLPFLFPSRDAAYKVLDGPIGQQLLDTLTNVGLVGVVYWENGFRYITNDKYDIYLPTDIPKGFKIRTMENEIQMQTFVTLGANAIPMAWAEVYTALQQGTIDAQENPLANAYVNNIHEVNHKFSMTGHVYAPCPVVFSKMSWDKYPPDIQQLLTESLQEARDYERKLVSDGEVELIGTLKNAGCSIILPEEIDKEAWRAAVQPVYDKYSDRIGADFIKEVQDAMK